MLVSVKGGEVKDIVDSIMRMAPQTMTQEQSGADVVCGFLERTQIVVQEEVVRNIAQTLTVTVWLLIRHRKLNRKRNNALLEMTFNCNLLLCCHMPPWL